MNSDTFVVCPHCGRHTCYEQTIGDDKTWTCLSCGFSSSTKMLEGSETEQAVTNKNPKLYQELKFVDEKGFVWYPSVITVPDKGMVYVDFVGTEEEPECAWAAVPMRELSRKERRTKKYFNQKYVANMSQIKHFDTFFEAASSIGLFENSEA